MWNFDCVVQYCPNVGREEYLNEILKVFPNAFVEKDFYCGKKPWGLHSGMYTFLRAINFIRPHIHLEDDIILCKGFKDKVESIISANPNILHSFFSLKQSDIDMGSGLRSGGRFTTTACFYLPEKMGKDICDFFFKEWRFTDDFSKNPTGFDLLVRAYLQKKKLKYFIHIPCLAQHRITKSAIDSRRSSKRITKAFIDDMEA